MKMKIMAAAALLAFGVILTVFFAPAAHAANGVDTVTIEELKAIMLSGENVAVIDVRGRTDHESEVMMIKDTLFIPLIEMKERAWEIPLGAKIITYCS